MAGIYGDGSYFKGYCWTPGAPGFDTLKMNGAAGAKIVQGNTVTFHDATLGDEVYEFRDDSPPTGGTAGRWWIYNGANSAASRTNFKDAINGVVDATRIAPPAGGHIFNMVAVQGAGSASDITVITADAPGGNPIGVDASVLWIETSETLATVTDVWDVGNFTSGWPPNLGRTSVTMFQISGGMIAKGGVKIPLPFPYPMGILMNMNRYQNEAWSFGTTTLGSSKIGYVTLSLAGGASPNNQIGDYIVVHAIEAAY